MTEQLSSIFNNSPHLTRSETMAYLEGKLSSSELRRVELHLADCEFCSDAVEGLKLMNAEEAEKMLDETNEAIYKSIQPKKESGIFIRRWMAAAAVFFALVISSFFINHYLHHDKSQMAQEIKSSADTTKRTDTVKNEISTLSQNGNTSSGFAEEKPVKKNQPIVFNNNVTTSANGLTSTKAPVVTEDLKLDEKNIGTVAEDKDEELQTAPAPKVLTDSFGYADKTTTVSGTTVTTKDDADSYSWAPTKNVEEISKTEKKSKNPTTQAREQYNNGDYDDALKSYKKTLNSDKNNMEANYFAGMSEMKLKQYDKAIAYFELVLAEPVNRYFEDAQWQKSLALLAKGDKQSAELLLNHIISNAGAYKDSAQQKLSELK